MEEYNSKKEQKINELQGKYADINFKNTVASNLSKIREYLKSELILANINGKLHYYDEDTGIYVYDKEFRFLRKCMRAMFSDIRLSHQSEVIGCLKFDIQMEYEEFKEDSSRYVHVENGIIDIQKREFLNFTSEIIGTSIVPITYNGNTDSIDEIVRDKFFKYRSNDELYEKYINMNDAKLRKLIMNKLKENDVNSLYGYMSAEEIADDYLTYTPLARQYLFDYYSQLEPTKSKMNWIVKQDFEDKYFYIGGSVGLVTLMLLGYKVNNDRYANVSLLSQRKLEKQNPDFKVYSCRSNFFERNNLESEDINRSWNNDAKIN